VTLLIEFNIDAQFSNSALTPESNVCNGINGGIKGVGQVQWRVQHFQVEINTGRHGELEEDNGMNESAPLMV